MEIDKKDELEINAAFKLKDEEKYNESLDILLKYKDKYENYNELIGVIGGIYYQIEDYENSFLYFKKATLQKPQWEFSSLGLYLSLIGLDRDDEAIEELKRYLSKYEPNRYKDTLEELYNNFDENILSEENREMIIKYYNKYCG